MKFRYYIADPFSGNVKGTNDEQVAGDYSQSEDFWVVDSETGEWLTPDGREPVHNEQRDSHE